MNVGHARDPFAPGPLYFSQAAFSGTTADSPSAEGVQAQAVAVKLCGEGASNIYECQRPLKIDYEDRTSQVSGRTICHRESAQLSVKVTPQGSGKTALIPLAWKKDYFCAQGDWLMYLLTVAYFPTWLMDDYIGRIIVAQNLLFQTSWLWNPIWMLWGIKTMHKIDISTPYSDKWCT